MVKLRYFVCMAIVVFAWHSNCTASVQVKVVDSCPQADFAAAEIGAAVQGSKGAGNWQITLRLISTDNDDEVQSEGFRIVKSDRPDHIHIDIQGIDPPGLLYGGLEVAEIIRTLGIAHEFPERTVC